MNDAASRPLADRMAHLGRLLVEQDNEAALHTTEDISTYAASRWALGYHAALEVMREWIEFDDNDTDDLLYEVECYVDSPDNWPHPEDESELDVLFRRLARWEERECQDAGQTIDAWRYMGILSAASALIEQGVALPQRWLDDQVSAVRSLMGEGDDE